MQINKMNRKLRRKLTKMASDKDIEQLAVDSVKKEIEETAQILTDDSLALSTDYTLSAMILAIDRTCGDTFGNDRYEMVLNQFRDIYSELLLSDEKETYLSMAEDVCGHELHIEFEHD